LIQSARKLGSIPVFPIGLGCMSLSHAYGNPPSKADAGALLLRALELGITHFDTAPLYGFGANEVLIGEVLRPHRNRLTLASKAGMHGLPVDGTMKRVIDGRPETLVASCETSLKNLRTEVIDLFYLHRWDRRVPIEESVGALARLVQSGKIRQIGLSEVSAETMRRAHRIHPIAAVQSEYSILTRNPEIAVLDACRDIEASFVAFSPVARGLTADCALELQELASNDIRRALPRFSPANYSFNWQALTPFRTLAETVGCSSAQLALRWLLDRAPHIVPIPGTTKIEHLEENVGAASIHLTEASKRALDAVVDGLAIQGLRYSSATQAEIDTERWPEECDSAIAGIN
jgi:aryl-alcohol dehydrogenase-like predicted oxidoreductase